MSDSSYTGALEAAGAIVKDCKWFGSYQGEWLADVELPDGRTGIILGYYGSCSGCDAFEAEFGYDYHKHDEHPDVDFKDDCKKCRNYKRRLAAFGEAYFSDLKSPEELAEEYSEKTYWSSYDGDVEQANWILERCDPNSEAAIKLRNVLATVKADY